MSSPPGPPAKPAKPDAADVVAASSHSKSGGNSPSSDAASDIAATVQKRPFDLIESAASAVAIAPGPAIAVVGAKGYNSTKKEEAIRLGATFFCAEGTYVICGICSGSEECGGLRVNLRTGRHFDLGYFHQHVNKGTHTSALANIEAEKETGTFKKQKTLFSGGFSGVAPKLKGPKSSAKKGTVKKKLPPPPPPPKR